MTQQELEAIQFLHWLNNPWVMTGFVLLVIWSAIWKGIALWKAARNSQSPWFVVLLLVNTVGILEIIYIFFFSKKREITK